MARIKCTVLRFLIALALIDPLTCYGCSLMIYNIGERAYAK